MKNLLTRVIAAEDGVAGLEYAFLAALIAITLVSEIGAVGERVAGFYTDTHTEYDAANRAN